MALAMPMRRQCPRPALGLVQVAAFYCGGGDCICWNAAEVSTITAVPSGGTRSVYGSKDASLFTSLDRIDTSIIASPKFATQTRSETSCRLHYSE